ncbi:MAG: hypothetical protein U9N87_09295, partial [Planctomycetota bacterium]|nr:hypothetical protein [Planctomycetota bacterium]
RSQRCSISGSCGSTPERCNSAGAFCFKLARQSAALLSCSLSAANQFDGEIWIEQIQLDTAPPIDRDKLKAGGDLLGDLLRDIDRLADDSEQLSKAADCLASLKQKAPAELQRSGVDPQDPEMLHRWLRQAEGLLLAHLADTEGRGRE